MTDKQKKLNSRNKNKYIKYHRLGIGLINNIQVIFNFCLKLENSDFWITCYCISEVDKYCISVSQLESENNNLLDSSQKLFIVAFLNAINDGVNEGKQTYCFIH